MAIQDNPAAIMSLSHSEIEANIEAIKGMSSRSRAAATSRWFSDKHPGQPAPPYSDPIYDWMRRVPHS